MRIGIANDSAIAVEVVRRVLIAGGHQIAWVALNGADAVERCSVDRPDLVLMDLIMPVMDGVQATAAIMQRTPCAILVVTSSVAGNAAKVFDAMGCGALDAVRTPVLGPSGDMAGVQPLLDKVSMIGKLIGCQHDPVRSTRSQTLSVAFALPKMVALASSTGGPNALAVILSTLPRRSDTVIVIVQHLDMQFSDALAEWLNEQSQFRIVLARQAMKIEPGVAFLAATNDHLVLAADLTLRYTCEPVENPYRPSVDIFFQSLREHWPKPGVAVLLTGMGTDGAAGLLALHQAGWHTIAQDQNSSVIYGMPGAAARIGAAAEILALPEIARAIVCQLDREKTVHAG